MSVLMRAREIVGRPVVTLDAAEDVAQVKDVLFDHAEARVLGFTLTKRGFLGSPLKEVLPWARVAALGRDAVMIETAAAIARPEGDMASGGGGGEVIGSSVITDAGKELGTVVDVILEVGVRAAVVGYEMRAPAEGREKDAPTRLIPIGDTHAASGKALIVPAAVERYARDDLTGFGGAVADYRARIGSGS
jgi:uncharacterized protein YrrD